MKDKNFEFFMKIAKMKKKYISYSNVVSTLICNFLKLCRMFFIL